MTVLRGGDYGELRVDLGDGGGVEEKDGRGRKNDWSLNSLRSRSRSMFGVRITLEMRESVDSKKMEIKQIGD